jgi:hypothetical protein
MDPTKFRMRYFIGFLFAAVISAAVLRHVLHVQGGFTRREILGGALAAAAISIFLAAVLLRRRRGR